MIERVDAQRAAGYRVVGAFEEGDEDAQAVIGFKVTENLVWGRYLYIEDVVARPSGRGKGHAPALMSWVLDQGRAAGCASVHLNSGTGADRRGAHRFYFNSGLRIAAHHFAMELGSARDRRLVAARPTGFEPVTSCSGRQRCSREPPAMTRHCPAREVRWTVRQRG